jgi:hypothetical protein
MACHSAAPTSREAMGRTWAAARAAVPFGLHRLPTSPRISHELMGQEAGKIRG